MRQLWIKSCIFVAKIRQSGGRCRLDERESGENPELYLQL